MAVDEEREKDSSSRASSVIKTRRLCRKTRRQPPLAFSTSFSGPFNPSGLFQIPLKAPLSCLERHEVAIRKIEISRGGYPGKRRTNSREKDRSRKNARCVFNLPENVQS